MPSTTCSGLTDAHRRPAVWRGLRGSRRFLLFVTSFVAPFLVAAPVVRAESVAVVKTHDGITPFDQAIEGLRKVDRLDLAVGSLVAEKERWPKVREKLAKKSPAIWVPVGKLALQELGKAGLEQPVVFAVVMNPARYVPDGAEHVAGVDLQVPPEIQLREIKKLLPGATRVGVLHDPGNAQAKLVAAAGGKLGLTVELAPMSDVSELGGALGQLIEKRIEALWLIPDRTVTPPRNPEAFEFLTEQTLRAGVPVIGYAAKHAKNGAAFALEPDYVAIGEQAGELVARILDGEAPSAIGIVPPRGVSLHVNLKVAEALKVPVPGDVRDRAASVFQ